MPWLHIAAAAAAAAPALAESVVGLAEGSNLQEVAWAVAAAASSSTAAVMEAAGTAAESADQMALVVAPILLQLVAASW